MLKMAKIFELQVKTLNSLPCKTTIPASNSCHWECLNKTLSMVSFGFNRVKQRVVDFSTKDTNKARIIHFSASKENR